MGIFAGHRHQSNFGREYQRGVIERGRDKAERERPIYPVSSISITFSVTMAVTTESQQQEQQQSTGFSSFSSFFTSLLPSARADEPQEEEDKSDDNAGGDDSGDAEETEAGGDDEEEEEEEEEPEDIYPEIREKCAESKECINLKHHFEHCSEKVQAGKGHKGED